MIQQSLPVLRTIPDCIISFPRLPVTYTVIALRKERLEKEGHESRDGFDGKETVRMSDVRIREGGY
jgi:hypothetical protein